MTLLRIRSAIVVEGLVIGADLLVDLVHVVDNDLRNRIVVLVASLTSLEEDIAVLCLAAENRDAQDSERCLRNSFTASQSTISPRSS